MELISYGRMKQYEIESSSKCHHEGMELEGICVITTNGVEFFPKKPVAIQFR